MTDRLSSIGGSLPPPPPPRSPGSSFEAALGGERPRLPTQLERAVGALSVALGFVVSDKLRGIAAQSHSGEAPLAPYDPRVSGTQIRNALSQAGAPKPDNRLVGLVRELAGSMDAHPVQLVQSLGQEIGAARANIASRTPQNPILVSDHHEPSMQDGIKYFKNVSADGVRIPKHKEDGSFHDEAGQATTMRVSVPDRLKPPGFQFDIDGVRARLFGEFGVRMRVETANEQFLHLDVPTESKLAAPPVQNQVPRVIDHPNGPQMTIRLTDGSELTAQITHEQADALRGARSANLIGVSENCARRYDENGVAYNKIASSYAGKNLMPGVEAPLRSDNTFGSRGENPIELHAGGPGGTHLTSYHYSLPPNDTAEPVTPGMRGAENARMYSGGHALNGEMFWMTPQQKHGMEEIGKSIGPIADALSAKYGLSDQTKADWKMLNFEQPDLPTFTFAKSILPEIGGTAFANLQRDVDDRLKAQVVQYGLQNIVSVHHTAEGPGDTLVPYEGPGKAYTNEMHIAPNGRKGIAALHDISEDLMRHGFDLVGALGARGITPTNLREMSDTQLETFTRDTIVPMIKQALPEGLGRKVVAGDTVQENPNTGKLSGSDASLFRQTAAAHGPENTVTVQVSTNNSAPVDPKSERQPAFVLDLKPGSPPELVRPSISPVGPNADVAPVYVSSQRAFNRTMLEAMLSLPVPKLEELQTQPSRSA